MALQLSAYAAIAMMSRMVGEPVVKGSCQIGMKLAPDGYSCLDHLTDRC